jgi:FAD/FMN-containing dehydrogenase
MVELTSWGRLSRQNHDVNILSDRNQAAAAVVGAGAPRLAYGMGRSYGDVCVNPAGHLFQTTGLDRFISLNEDTGVLVCEAGVLLRDIQRLVIPRGWILPVSPGTQLVTVGGAIANDVHGKNHHVDGSFGNHIRRLTLLRTNGEIIECGPDLRPDWFAATVGGIGLTGFIISAEIELKRVPGPWLTTENVPYSNLDEFLTLADGSEAHWEHTVSWIDCISSGGGRGLFMRGNHVAAQGPRPPRERTRTVPLVPPFSMVNQLTLRLFNTFYYHYNKLRSGQSLSHYEPFFYPLDNIQKWNRIYGPNGFYQYQCVVPRQHGRETIQAMLHAIAKSGNGSFLAVLKTFQETHPAVGMLSFPRPGITLALDFPNRKEKTERLFGSLDAIVREASGRIYLAKDARMPKDLFESGYPRLQEFLKYRDPNISSAMSRRLMDY